MNKFYNKIILIKIKIIIILQIILYKIINNQLYKILIKINNIMIKKKVI
jgi:hypothetical protein